MYKTDALSNINRSSTAHKSFGETQTRKKHLPKTQHIQSNQKAWINADTFKSIFAIALIACLIFGVFIVPVGAKIADKKVCKNPQFDPSIPKGLMPYNSRPKPLVSDVCPVPIEKFHHSIPKVIHAGKMKGLERILCVIPDKMPAFEECKEVAEMMDREVKERFPKKYKEAMTDKDSEKGLPIHSPEDLGYSIKSVFIGISPQKESNYRNALSFLESEILDNPKFFERSEADIVTSLMTTNALIEDKLSKTAGILRNDFSFILDDNTAGLKGMRALLIKKGGTPKDLKIFDHFFSKKINKITDEQARVLRMFCYLPTYPDAVESEMYTLAREIKEMGMKMLHSEIDPIVVAAYVHQEIGRIHPFEDGNGRTARAWLNVMLQIGGERGIIFPSEEEYTAAIIEDQARPGAFTEYLAKVIEWNRMQPPLQDNVINVK